MVSVTILNLSRTPALPILTLFRSPHLHSSWHLNNVRKCRPLLLNRATCRWSSLSSNSTRRRNINSNIRNISSNIHSSNSSGLRNSPLMRMLNMPSSRRRISLSSSMPRRRTLHSSTNRHLRSNSTTSRSQTLSKSRPPSRLGTTISPSFQPKPPL